MTPAILKTYALLRMFCIKETSCFTGVERFSKELGTDIRTVERHLSKLKELGLIRIETRGAGQTTIKHIVPLEEIYSKEEISRRV